MVGWCMVALYSEPGLAEEKGAAAVPKEVETATATESEKAQGAPVKAEEEKAEVAAGGSGRAGKVVAGENKPAATKEPETAGGKPKKDESETVEVQRAEMEILVETDGVLAAREGRALRVDTEKWKELQVLEVVAHGSTVKKGEVLIRFDTEQLEDAIADLERELPKKEEMSRFAQAELDRLKANEAGDLAKAKRTYEETKTDYDYYFATARPQRLKRAAYSLKRAGEHLEYQEEELRQLLMMYEADDLTEETEEIILKRQRSQVENAGNSLEQAEIQHVLTVETTTPRADAEQKRKRERAEVEWALAKAAIPHARRMKEQEVVQARHALKKAKQGIAELRADLKILSGFRAPADGMVVYGELEKGKLATAARLKGKLRPRGKVTPDEVLITVIDVHPSVLNLKIQEKNLAHLREGIEGVAKIEGMTGHRVGVKLIELGLAPTPDGSYSGVAEIVGTALPGTVRPGRTAKVVFQGYFKADAVVVPSKVVHERMRGGRLEEVVYLPGGAKKKAVARVVQTGPREGEKTVIVSGLKAGEMVLSKKP